MKKYIILTLTLLTCAGLTFAQDEDGGTGSGDDSEDVGFERKAGEFTGALIFGRGSYLQYGSVPPAPGDNLNWTVSGSAPYANTVDGNSNQIGNMVGGEARYFITDRIAAKVSGGVIVRNTPAIQNIQSYNLDPDAPNAAWIPHYGSVIADNTVETNINIGGEYHFSSKAKRIFPYLGANFNHYYSRRSAYDPSVYYQSNIVNATGGSGSSGGTTVDDGILIYDVGNRTVEVVGIGAQAVAGLDFYLLDGFYFGFDIKPVSFLYAYNSKRPAPGLPLLQAETTTWSFMAQPMFKIGFFIGSL
jgi:hypothetical protein